MTTVFAVANQKGGVGKTTTTLNLGAALAERGRRVLLVDHDPQANLTAALGLGKDLPSTYDLLLGEVSAATILRSVVQPAIGAPRLNGAPARTTGPTSGLPPVLAGGYVLDLLPSSPDLAGAEIELVSMSSRERRLATAIAPIVGGYDYVLIDCPPSLGLLTLNALVAADGVLAPVQCEYLALEGLTQLLETLRRVREALNPRLQRLFLLMTMFDARTGLAQSVVDEVQRHFPQLFLSAIIPRTVRLGEAPSYGQSILRYDSSGRGAASYRALAQELDSRVLGNGAADDGAGHLRPRAPV